MKFRSRQAVLATIGPPVLLLGLLLSLSLGAAAQDQPLTRGGMLSASCAGCHGPDGRSPGAIPSIDGKSADYIRQALEEFRSGARESTVMGRHAKAYSEDEIREIAEYLASRSQQ